MRLSYRLGLINGLLVLAILVLVAVDSGSRLGPPLVAGIFALAAAATYVAVRTINRPLERLSQTARELTRGDGAIDVGEEAQVPFELVELAAGLDQVRRASCEQITRAEGDKAHLEAILNSISEGILVVDREGQVSLANKGLEQLFDYEGPLEGRPWVEGVRSKAVEDALAKVLATGEEQSCQIDLAGAIERHLEVRLGPIKQQGQCTGAVAVFHEITRLVQLERARRDFVANVSHELRTPLTAIKGYAETLSEGALSDRRATARFVQIILSHSDRLNRLLDDLLELARLESDQLEVHLDDCSLLRLAEAGASAVSPAATSKNIDVRLDVADLQVRCDPRLLEQAIINLLDNAVKYTPEGGRVSVAGHRDGDGGKIVFEVSDTGIGIPPADQVRVFERFYRVDKGRSRDMGGTGLGLSIVRHVLEVHGEQAFVRSQLGQGSTFGFTLALAAANRNPAG